MSGDIVPTSYSTGSDKHLYIETEGLLRAQIDGVYVLAIFFLITCWLVVSARMWVRTRLLNGMDVDDWWLLGTQIVFTVYAVLLCFICANLEEHAKQYANGEVPTAMVIPDMIIVCYCLYCVCTITFRISLGYFFLKIFSANRTWRIVLYITMVLPGLLGILNIAWTAKLPCELTSVFFAGLPSCTGFALRTDWAVVAALWAGVSAIVDLLYGVMAFLAINKLQMPWKTRVTAVVLCCLGCTGGFAAIIRLSFLIISPPEMSVLGAALQVSIWSVIEPGLAIVASSFAALRPLWNKLRNPAWNPSDHRSTQHGTTKAKTFGQADLELPMRSQRGAEATSQLRKSSDETDGKKNGIMYQIEVRQMHEHHDLHHGDDDAARLV